ncbi:MAG TPA: CapA family protein [Lacipirellulaceae bacterium]|nr:CapA family protein [Lacipirellulaceae bacterium]
MAAPSALISRAAKSAQSDWTLALAGDCIITKPLQWGDLAFEELVKKIAAADLAIANCEIVLSDRADLAAGLKGRDINLVAPARGAAELKRIGFNVVSLANNHALDYGVGGLKDTMRALAQHGLVSAGAGADLSEASHARSVGGVSLIACATTYPDWSAASPSGPFGLSRSGINPIALSTRYNLEAAKFEAMRVALSSLDLQPDSNGAFELGGRKFSMGPTGTLIEPAPDDTDRIVREIVNAKAALSLPVLYIHDHSDHQPGGWLQRFARHCIDKGCVCVFVSGSHRLAGLEIYQKRPIFYGLGNFLFQFESISTLPPEVFKSYGLDPDETAVSDVTEIMLSLFEAPPYWKGVVPIVAVAPGRTSVQLIPIDLQQHGSPATRGSPVLATGSEAQAVFGSMAELSNAFGQLPSALFRGEPVIFN